MFLDKFYPDNCINSVYEMDFQRLYDEGIRLLIFDIDNTLVRHGAPADAQAVRLFEKLKNIGFFTCLISNNSKQRVAPFAKAVGADAYVYKADKPSRSAYQRALDTAGMNVDESAFFGDQLFTDIFGAKRMGIRNFVVKPIHKKEEIQIVFKRRLEKIVYYFYNKNLKKIRRENGIIK